MASPDDFPETPDGLRRAWQALCSAASGPDRGLDTAWALLTASSADVLGPIAVPQLAAIFAVGQGTDGLAMLAKAVHAADELMRRRIALEALWATAEGRACSVSGPGRVDQPPVPPALRAAAAVLVDDLIAQASMDLRVLAACFGLADGVDLGVERAVGFAERFMRVTADASIAVTAALLDEFHDLIDAERPEAEYQRFLQDNPVLLDPIAAEVLPTAPLGLEFRTDFVLRRHDGRYVVVEIEKPQDPLLTARHDIAAPLTHAWGQVLDFQHWIAENSSYAQKSFPDVAAPAGLVIMGRRDRLDARARAKLSAWETNSRHIELTTYDDLLGRGRALLSSVRRRDWDA